VGVQRHVCAKSRRPHSLLRRGAAVPPEHHYRRYVLDRASVRWVVGRTICRELHPKRDHTSRAALLILAASVVASSSSARRSPTLARRPSVTRCATSAIGPSGTTSPCLGRRLISSAKYSVRVISASCGAIDSP